MRALCTACLWALMGALPAGQEPAAHVVGGEASYVIRAGDTVSGVAARFGVTAAQLIALNQLPRPDLLIPGDTLAIRNPHLAVVDASGAITINVPQRMLFLADGGGVTGYPVTVGSRAWPTALGRFTVVDKEVDPTWDVPTSIQREMARQGKPVITQMAPSPQNPLGNRWLRLSLPGLGIHGTNAPASIYRYASHGCIRMHPEHIVELFDRVAVGVSGSVVYRPVIIAVIGGRIWLEAHPDPYRREPDGMALLRQFADERGLNERVDWAAVSAALGRRDGLAEDVTRADRRLSR
jgi:L,D-transpeptidase ErfK/SrfK